MVGTKTNGHLTLPTFIPLSQAAEQTGLSVERLTRLVQAGRIAAVQLPSGEIVVSRRDANKAKPTPPTPKEELPEYKKHRHLRGHELGIAEAGRKYGIPQSTINRWVQQGYITRLGQTGQKILIDEADVAYCAEIYRKRGGQGRWLFNPDGTPYTPTTRQGNGTVKA